MKKRLIISIILTTAFLAIAISIVFIINLINAANDYKSVLGNKERQVNTNIQQQGNKSQKDLYPPSGTNQFVQTSGDGAQNETREQELLNQISTTAGTNIINILFLGIDKTEERDKTIGIYRTDTIALVSINLDTKIVNVLCIPRDTYTFIPIENKKDKINHAYAFGSLKGDGVKSSIETVERFIKYSNIDYYFALDMEPLPQIVDALGGIELDVEIDMKDHGANLTRGRQSLDGRKVFDYIHWRYSGMGDIDRVKRQQKFAKAMIAKLKETNQLVNSVGVVLSFNKNIKTNISFQQMIALANLMKDIPQGNTSYYNITGSSRIIDKIWYWIPDETQTDATLKKVFLMEGVN